MSNVMRRPEEIAAEILQVVEPVLAQTAVPGSL
jgi:hypothetical protein